jgi:signal transduction histidine kinase
MAETCLHPVPRWPLDDEAPQRHARLRDYVETVIEQRVAQRTDELREIVAGLESFNRNISHDLRNPLAGIAGLARLADQSLSSGDTAAVEACFPSSPRRRKQHWSWSAHCFHWPVPAVHRWPPAACGWRQL